MVNNYSNVSIKQIRDSGAKNLSDYIARQENPTQQVVNQAQAGFSVPNDIKFEIIAPGGAPYVPAPIAPEKQTEYIRTRYQPVSTPKGVVYERTNAPLMDVRDLGSSVQTNKQKREPSTAPIGVISAGKREGFGDVPTGTVKEAIGNTGKVLVYNPDDLTNEQANLLEKRKQSYKQIYESPFYPQKTNDLQRAEFLLDTAARSSEQKERQLAAYGTAAGIALLPIVPVVATSGLALTLPGLFGATTTAVQTKRGAEKLTAVEREELTQIGFNAISGKAAQGGFISSALDIFPGSRALSYATDKQGAKQTFEGAVVPELIKKGYSEAQAQGVASQLAESKVFGRGVGEVAGAVSGNVTGELIGQRFAAAQGIASIPKSKGFFNVEAFKKGFVAIAPAGVVEGGVTYSSQQIARQQPIDPFGLALAGAFGGASAGVVGGGIISLFKGSAPVLGKAGLTAAYVAEPPGELGGDILAGFVPGVARTPGVVVPAFTFTPAFTNTFTPTSTPTPTTTPTKTTTNIFGTTPVQPKGPTPVPPITITPTPVPPIILMPDPTPVPPITPTPTDTETTTNIFTNTFSFTPTITPVVTAPGFFPPFFGGGFGTGIGGKGRGTKRLTYFNELDSAFRSFGAIDQGTKIKRPKRQRLVMIDGQAFKIGKRVKR